MTIFFVITIGIVVTILLGYLACRNWTPANHRQVHRPVQTPVAQRPQQAAGVYKSKWLRWPIAALLVIATVIGIVRYGRGKFFNTSPADFADTTRTMIVRPGQPAEGVMPVGWRMDWWGDPDKFDSHVIWRGRNKVRVFTTKAGVESAEIKIRVYPCSAEAPC